MTTNLRSNLKSSAALFMATLCAVLAVQAQQFSCCVPSVNQQNHLLAMNENFAAAHQVPAPFTLSHSAGNFIAFKTTDGKDGRAYLVKCAVPTDKVVFLFQEWWGVNDYIQHEAKKIQAALGEVDVYAIDLYDGKTAATVPEAQKLMGEMKEERSKAIIQGAIALVGKKAKIVSMGWCLGGAWSLQAALLEGKQARGCVMYYGMPEADVKKLKQLRCDVLGIFALHDGHITPEIVQQFEANMKSLKKKVTIHNYDSYHAFANPSNPRHHKAFTADAYAKAVAFLKSKLFR